MIEDAVKDDVNAACLSLRHEVLEVGECAERRVDLRIVGSVVAVV